MMETLKEIQDQFLKCPVCLQNYTSPKLLPCLHTFCRQCLVEVLKKSIGDDNGSSTESDSETEKPAPHGKHFNCPVCRADIELNVPNGNSNFAQWTDMFPDNHFVSSLMEKIDMQATDKYCESCCRDGNRIGAKAENWCQTCKVVFCDSCIKAHNVIKACREHIVVSLRDMRNDPLESIRSNKKEIPCFHHRDKVIEYYCVDCHVTICSSCVAVQHRRCEMVETLVDAAQKLKPETEYVQRNLQMQNEVLREWREEHEKELGELSTNKEMIMKEMSTIRKRVNEALENLENKLIVDLDQKNMQTATVVKGRMNEIDEMKKNVNNTGTFLKNLIQFGSDSELLTVFDAIKLQVDDMRANIQKSRLSKLSTRHRLIPDSSVQRLLELHSIGKIVDLVDLKKETFLNMNGLSEKEGQPPQRRSSIKRTGTFRVERSPTQSPASTMMSSSTSSVSSTSSESIGSQEILTPPVRARRGSSSRPSSARDTPIPRPSSRPTSARDSPRVAVSRTTPVKSNTLPRAPRTPRTERSQKMADVNRVNSLPRNRSSTSNVSNRKNPETENSENANTPPQTKSRTVPMLFSFNGKTDGDAKKCWPLDVTMLEDGTPVITDFHNKKVKAFDATGNVMGEVAVPSWPHGIVDVASAEVVVTLPELATIMFVSVQDNNMRIRKRVRTVKQYRGISCDVTTSPNDPVLVVSCCASGIQCVDVLALDGTVLQTYREDRRQPGKLLFTWPYYVTTNAAGEILVSDCQSRNGIICICRDGGVKFEQVLPDNIVCDPRGICTDRQGNLFLADKTGNSVHALGPDGEYKSRVLCSADGLIHPIAVCLSPFGHLIITQENGDVKVFKYS
ncbi:tripartite motif-containing protein 2-like [Pecten maximus]|uniref:tripartite motif-containing protein 2-like n=2 Tax=Pecten maximus TaxID=6579 RepID=UPI0014586533|nr:tripartite motif-containing protein 2-like [Pecten maximus]